MTEAGEIPIPAVSLEELKIGYRLGKRVFGLLAGHSFSFSVEQSEMVGVVGRNGAGKSTLLRTVAGLQSPLEGSVNINGHNISSYGRLGLSKLVSYVSTEVSTLFNQTVLEFASAGRFPHTGWFGNLSRTDLEVVWQSLEYTGCSHLAGKYVNRISDGERQKAMIARALAQDTSLIILDEPTAFLDVASRYEMLHLLSNLTRTRHKTILFSTHDLSVALDEADKLWLLSDDGAFQGAPEDLLIDKVFRKLYNHSLVEFDLNRWSFSLVRESKGNIGLEGTGDLYVVTRKALERIGYTISGGSEFNPSVVVWQSGEKATWQLNRSTNSYQFGLVYDLISFLRHAGSI